MKTILDFIDQQKQQLNQTRFIQFLQDKSIDPRQRFAWAPAFAPFVMMFKDFNQIILYQEPVNSRIQEIINQHSQEDVKHWSWFLEDLKLMGYDISMNYSDALKFIWGDENIKVRQWAYKIYSLCPLEEDIVIKLAVAESIEAAGNCAFTQFAKVAQEMTAITKKHYPYFGPSHLEKETGHMISEMDSVEDFIAKIALTEEQQEKALTKVEQVFYYCAEAMEEMYTFAQTHIYEQSFIINKTPQILLNN